MPGPVQTRRIPIHQSLLRPNLLAGGERTLTLLNVTLTASLVFGLGTIPAIATGLVLGMLIQWALVLMARRDPQNFDTYRRHIHHQRFYAGSAWMNAVRGIVRA